MAGESDSGLPTFAKLRIAVVGHAVADRYVYARPERLSREAPVPVFVEDGEEIRPGGAANVAANLAALGCRVDLFAPIGDDGIGRGLRRELERRGVRVPGGDACAAYCVPVKTRVLAAEPHRTPQQVLRIDRPPTEAPDPSGIARLADALELADVDAVLYSDYGYFDLGTYVPVDRVLRGRGVIRVLDPRLAPGPFELLDALTPNLDDFEAALASDASVAPRDDGDLAARAGRARERFGVRDLLVTLGNRGMLLSSGDGAWHVPPTGRDGVVDVSGAGDTAAAVFTAAIALGESAPVAMALANAAAGDVVMISGTVPVDLGRLRAAWPLAPRAHALHHSAGIDAESVQGGVDS